VACAVAIPANHPAACFEADNKTNGSNGHGL